MADLIFVGQFVASKAGKTGLTVTVDVDRYTISDGSRSSLVTGGSATEGRRGLYHYRLASADLSLYQYVATFVTADATVDQQEVAAIGLVVPDALTSSRLAPTTAGRTLDVSAGGEAGVDWANVGSPTTAVDLTNTQINSVSGSVGSVTSGVTLADDAITSAKFDESTAFPVKFADTGSTKIARVGADSDTLETLSDQLDAIQLVTDAIDTSAVTVTSTNDAGVLTITRGVTFAATVSGLTISGTWSKLYFTLKESDYDDDDDAIVQIVETNPSALTDGLLYLDSAAIASPITIADGTLTVNQAGGTVAIAITDNATAHLAKASGLVWDIKTKDAAGATVQNATGTASIVRAITQTI